MTRLIDADALLESINTKEHGDLVGFNYEFIRDIITNAPTVDIAKLFEGYKAPEPLPVIPLTHEQLNTPFGTCKTVQREGCEINPVSSRVCELGIKCCTVYHKIQREGWVSLPIEPVAWKRTRKSNGETEYFTDREYKHETLFDWIPLYAAPTGSNT